MLTEKKVDELNVMLRGVLNTTAGKKRNSKWACHLAETVIGEFLIVPCTSGKMVKSESYWMNNCCREYVERCAGGEYSIFSIRSRTGERLATLGVVCDKDGWAFDQCYGPSNEEVLEETVVYLDEDGELQCESYPTEIYYIVQEVVRLMNAGSSLILQ